ncbi:amino acid permease, partial [Methylobacterium soli]|uniref:amino acid permease n=1 Tax=Methylobacterium soli TaxID=553447 RepID=UPI001EE18A25
MASGVANDLMRTKSLERLNADAEAGEHTLQRTLGPWSLIGLGIGAVIGAGLFSLTGIAAAEHAGPAVVISFAIAALGCAFAGMCYSELAGMIPVAGSAYTYAYATMGEFVAWIIGWDLVLEYAVGSATVSVSWSKYVTRFLHEFGVDLPASLVHSPFETYQLADGTAAHGLVNLPAILIICAASFLLMVGIRESARVNAIVVAIKLAVVAVVIGVGVFYIKRQNYVPFIPENTGTFGEYGWSGIMRAAGVVFFAYIGFDAVSTAAQEAKNPQRNMMIGILGSLAICTVIYILFAGVLTGLVRFDAMKGDAAPVNTAIAQTPFPWLTSLVTLGIIAGFSTVEPWLPLSADAQTR